MFWILDVPVPLRLNIVLDSGRPLPLRLKIVLDPGRPQQWSKLNLDWPRVVDRTYFTLLYNFSRKIKAHYHINVPFQLFRAPPRYKRAETAGKIRGAEKL